MRTDGQRGGERETVMPNLMVAFGSFANAPKIIICDMYTYIYDFFNHR